MRHRVLAMIGVLAFCLSTAASAQEGVDTRESAIGTRLSDFGGFLGLDMRFGDMMGEFAAFAGGEAAVLLKRRVYLGVRGTGLATDQALIPGSAPGSSTPLEMGYGGVVIGYVVPTASLVQLTADALVGAGGVRPRGSGGDNDYDAVFVFEPTLGAELKLARYARVGMGVGYRFVGGVDLAGVSDDDLRGVVGTVTLRAGWF